MGRDPSRTTVDKFGNVWVANRAEAGWSGSEYKGSITRIGVIIGGVRGNKNLDGTFTDDPNGQYLRPPFDYSTVVDRDGDGYIKTSNGLSNILPWPNTGGANTHGGVTLAEDEAIINYTRVAGTGTRTVAVDANNDLWTGGYGDQDHEKVDGVTGQPVAGTRFNAGCGGYGGLIDGNNVLWSARGGTGLRMMRYDATAGTSTCYTTNVGYGLGIDPVTGEIWLTSLNNNGVMKYSSTGTLLATYTHGATDAQGVAVDASGNVWVAHSINWDGTGNGFTTVGHLRTDGTFVGNVSLGGSRGPTGVAVDANGKIWVTNYYAHNAMRIDPTAGAVGGGGYNIGAVDLTVSLGSGAYPYNYSDMTGYVALGASSPSGSWTVVHDGEVADGEWGLLTWSGSEPTGTDIKVEVRAANDEAALAGETFVEVQSGVPFCDLDITGRYLEIRVSLSRTSGEESPVFEELVLGCCNEPPVAVCQDITVAADETCMAAVEAAQIDNGSYDPDAETGWLPVLSMSPAGPFALGDHVVTLTITDADGATDECTATITVADMTAPEITLSSVAIDPWPANHEYLTVTVDEIVDGISDACDGLLSEADVIIASATSDELDDATGKGDGSTVNDIVIATDCRSVDLRKERDGNGNGRVYRINLELTDAAGNVGTASFPVTIRRNNGNGEVAVEDDDVYGVLGTCGGAGKVTVLGSPVIEGYALEQNIPNPFTGLTEIPFTLAVPGHATITIYDALGASVATALDELRPAGPQSVGFDAAGLPSGTYYCVLEAGGVKLVRSMTLSR